jgi:S-adenosylmethionine:tRNA ribosyltransferase-isomerase
MRAADFDYTLPEELIALQPALARDQSRLLALERQRESITHEPSFRGLLRYLRKGDLLVLNNSRVLPARLRGYKESTGGQVELLLLEELERNCWWVLLRPGKRVRPGTRIRLPRPRHTVPLEAIVRDKNAEGHVLLNFTSTANIRDLLDEMGEIPLPPYIPRRSGPADNERYQTTFAREPGSVAAPTAGLHFTNELLGDISKAGVEIHYVTLHVGLGTFAPVKEVEIERHVMHDEQFTLETATARAINTARANGRRIVAVGTTTVRVLESVASRQGGELVGTTGRTRIFIYPPCRFQVVDALLTNFHLPRSTLLMLVSAFAAPNETRGRELVLRAYTEAIRERYRFFSYGDAMLIY